MARAIRSRGGVYYKDNPLAVERRDNARVFYNGREVSKFNPCFDFLKPGRHKGRFAGLIGTAVNTMGMMSDKFYLVEWKDASKLINSNRGN